MASKRERNQQAVLVALANGRELTHPELVEVTGLSPAAVSRAVMDVRAGGVEFIPVPVRVEGFVYKIAETPRAMVPGGINQAKHGVTRQQSKADFAHAYRRLATTAAERTTSEALDAMAEAGMAQDIAWRKVLQMVEAVS